MQELNIWREYLNVLFKAIACATLFWIVVFMVSCNTHKHITSSQTNIDTSKSIQKVSETYSVIDSNSSQGSMSNVDFTDSSVIGTTDTYTVSKVDYYAFDTESKTSYKVKTETKKTGAKKTIENKNQKLKSNTVDTTNKTAHTEIQKKDSNSINQSGKSEVGKFDEDKTVKVAPFRLALAIGGALLVLIAGIYAAYKIKNKVKKEVVDKVV